MGEFERSLQKVLIHEGGFVHLKADPGGATNQGVTQAVYDTYRRTIGAPKRSVKLLEKHERDDIYRSRYWSLIKGDSLPVGVSYVVFDGAVNSGVSQSVKWLQRALGINADGVIGPQTINAAKDHPNHDRLIADICDRRMAFLKALKTWSTFGKGWAARVNGVRAVGQAWASGIDANVPASEGGGAKASITDAKEAPPKAPGDIAAGGGTISAIIAQTQEQLTPYVNIGFVAKAAAVLTIAGAVVAVAGIGYRFWAARRAAALKEALS